MPNGQSNCAEDDPMSGTMHNPLDYLGHDIFVDVLSWLGCVEDLLSAEQVCKDWRETVKAHSSWLWRFAAIGLGIDEFNIQACDALALTGQWSVDENDHRPIVHNREMLLDTPKTPLDWLSPRNSRRPTPLATPGLECARVNWRYVCESYYQLHHAWSRGCCRLRWITPPTPNNLPALTEDPPSNTVWRIKSVPAENVLFATSRMNGLMAIDRYTSAPLFSINGLDGYAHLEAERGFVVFDRPGLVQPMAGWDFDDSANTALEVWRNHEARERSKLPREGLSLVAGSAQSHTHPDIFVPEDKNSPLPRGHLEHFRTITPPAKCMAYRLHVDGATSSNPRAVLASAGTAAVYIWHLEEDRPMDKIERGWQDIGRPNYIELDDEYVFVCLDRQMHIYSRQTLSHVVSFPPRHMTPDNSCGMAYSLSLAEDFKAIPDSERQRREPGTNADGKPAPIGRASVYGYKEGNLYHEAIGRGVAMHSQNRDADDMADIEYGFSACHFTSRHLVCTAKCGAIFVVQDYKDVFKRAAREPEGRRHATVAASTHMIGLGTTVRQMTTVGDQIAVCTSFNVILIDASRIPDIKKPILDEASRPRMRAHVLLGNHPQAMKMSSCIQADARTIYLTYWAAGETDAAQNHGSPTFPPNAAIEGFGMCVKAWTFSADWANSTEVV